MRFGKASPLESKVGTGECPEKLSWHPARLSRILKCETQKLGRAGKELLLPLSGHQAVPDLERLMTLPERHRPGPPARKSNSQSPTTPEQPPAKTSRLSNAPRNPRLTLSVLRLILDAKVQQKYSTGFKKVSCELLTLLHLQAADLSFALTQWILRPSGKHDR